ncbi:unnamed protein product [Camellia sinensis]
MFLRSHLIIIKPISLLPFSWKPTNPISPLSNLCLFQTKLGEKIQQTHKSFMRFSNIETQCKIQELVEMENKFINYDGIQALAHPTWEKPFSSAGDMPPPKT